MSSPGMRILLMGIVLLAGQTVATADVITYADGLVHTAVPTVGNPSYNIQSGTTLNVGTGTPISVVGADGTMSTLAVDGIDASGASKINIGTGAQISGGSPGAIGVLLIDSTINATGGSATGGSAPAFSNAGDGLSLLSSRGSISGGTFTGGNSAGVGGKGLNAYLAGTSLNISGGTFQGGQGGTVGGGQGASLYLTGPQSTATISGGHFQAGVDSAGQIQAAGIGITEENGAKVTISGGAFLGTTGSGTPPVQLGVDLGTNSVLAFTGTNLKLTTTLLNSSQIEGTITGTLSDGEMISDVILVTSDLGSVLTLTANGPNLISFAVVPEPSSFVLTSTLATVGGLAWFVKRRRQVKAL